MLTIKNASTATEARSQDLDWGVLTEKQQMQILSLANLGYLFQTVVEDSFSYVAVLVSKDKLAKVSENGWVNYTQRCL